MYFVVMKVGTLKGSRIVEIPVRLRREIQFVPPIHKTFSKTKRRLWLGRSFSGGSPPGQVWTSRDTEIR